MRLDSSMEGGKPTSKFSCAIANPQSPDYPTKNYECKASDDLSAMRAVLEKIEKGP